MRGLFLTLQGERTAYWQGICLRVFLVCVVLYIIWTTAVEWWGIPAKRRAQKAADAEWERQRLANRKEHQEYLDKVLRELAPPTRPERRPPGRTPRSDLLPDNAGSNEDPAFGDTQL